jgi:hypothetical protein
MYYLGSKASFDTESQLVNVILLTCLLIRSRSFKEFKTATGPLVIEGKSFHLNLIVLF